MIQRHLLDRIKADLDFFPVVAIIGARQVGKTTLAKSLQGTLGKDLIYLDLESDADLSKMEDAETYLLTHIDRSVVIDEVQRMPRLFPLLRSVIDRNRVPGRFILLGSATPELLKDSSESLAGRIVFHELSPLTLTEVTASGHSLQDHWFRGGFPEALLAPSEQLSIRWLDNFLKTFIERDIRKVIGYDIDPVMLTRFVRMLGHLHGQIINAADLSRSLDISVQSVNKYLFLLRNSFITQQLEPYYRNIGKRLTKSAKFYFRDSGLHHALVRFNDKEALYSSHLLGASWEGYVIEQIRRCGGDSMNYFFYRTQNGAKIDLLIELPSGKFAALEIKYSNAPTIQKGFFVSCEDLKPDYKFVITPGSDNYTRTDGIEIISLMAFLRERMPVL
jgi:uncharacterized protein